VCRFCGVGCGIMVATKEGRIVATKGDPKAPVNRGLNCVKGYFNGKIMYGQDRLTQPLMRMKDGKFDKKGQFVAGELGAGPGRDGAPVPQGLRREGTHRYGCVRFRPADHDGRLCQNKLFKAGFRSNNLDNNARNCMASAVTAFIQTFGIDEPAGNYDDIEHTDTMVLWGANMAEMHPILWSRITDRRLGHKACRIVNLSTYRNASSDSLTWKSS
jgi:nitrate reductase NapA